MKKLLSILLAIIALCIAAFAEPAATELVPIEGLVLEISEDGGYLINTETHGEVMALMNEETFVESDGEISVGDYLYIDYDGQMTRSLPPQITASVIRMYRIEGAIVEHFAEENAVMLSTETHGEVYATLPEEWSGQEIDAESLTIYFNGAMTMSLPPQINAGFVAPLYSLQGSVTEIADTHLVLGEGMEAVQVNFEEGSLPQNLQVGDVIRVLYNGQMTRSLPPQVFASQIIQISR